MFQFRKYVQRAPFFNGMKTKRVAFLEYKRAREWTQKDHSLYTNLSNNHSRPTHPTPPGLWSAINLQ